MKTKKSRENKSLHTDTLGNSPYSEQFSGSSNPYLPSSIHVYITMCVCIYIYAAVWHPIIIGANSPRRRLTHTNIYIHIELTLSRLYRFRRAHTLCNLVFRAPLLLLLLLCSCVTRGSPIRRSELVFFVACFSIFYIYTRAVRLMVVDFILVGKSVVGLLNPVG